EPLRGIGLVVCGPKRGDDTRRVTVRGGPVEARFAMGNHPFPADLLKLVDVDAAVVRTFGRNHEEIGPSVGPIGAVKGQFRGRNVVANKSALRMVALARVTL